MCHPALLPILRHYCLRRLKRRLLLALQVAY
jgi:hypothetical protein